MKRIGFLYEKLIDEDNIRRAIVSSSKGKRKRKYVQNVLNNLDFYVQDLKTRFQNFQFITEYKKKTVTDGLSHKERDILVPSFYPDQCAHHCIVNVLKPIVFKSIYINSCANLPGRGLDYGSKAVERATKRDIKNAKYCLKLDIRHFYPSINHDVLKSKFVRKIKDKKFLDIIFYLIDSCEEGLPIGNYTSPWFAEIYLKETDEFILNNKYIKHYIRYSDDHVMLGKNKGKMHEFGREYQIYLKEKLKVEIKGNWQLFKVQENYKGRRIDFLGKCYGIGFTTIRKRRSLVFIKQSKKLQKLFNEHKKISYKMACGFISRSNQLLHTDSYKLKEKYYDCIDINVLKKIVSKRDKYKNSHKVA